MQRSFTARLAVCAAILFGEYLWLAVRFDGRELFRRGGVASHLSSIGESVTALTLCLTAGLILNRGRLAKSFEASAQTLPRVSVPFALVHLLGYAASALAFARLFSVDPSSNAAGAAWIATWAASGCVSLLCLLRSLLGPATWQIIGAVGRTLGSGLLLATFAYVASDQSRPLWPSLARLTLSATGQLLALFTSPVLIDPARMTLEAHGLELSIETGCSGIEGMAIVSVFLAGYVYHFRHSLRVRRAALLVPVVAGLAWCLNVLRLALLVAVGVFVSPEAAFGGFHSKAGWVAFCLLSLGSVLALERSSFFRLERPRPRTEFDNPTAEYLLPLLTVLAVGLGTGLFAASLDMNYAPRVVAAGAVLWTYRRRYAELRAYPSLEALGIGVAVFLAWLWLGPRPDAVAARNLDDAVHALPPDIRDFWLGFRLLGAVITVPLVEELAFRGFLQRRLIARDFTEVSFQKLTLLAALGSAFVFGALHQAWLVGTFAGVAYSFAAFRRGRLIDAVAAHATTNALLAACVLCFDRWDLWT